VPIQANEDTISKKGAITKKIALRLLGEELPQYLGSTSTASPPMTSDVAPSVSHTDFDQKVINALKMLHQQVCMMEKQQLRIVTNLT
ncbi:hypothetical protein J1N35_043780, partial [Gossypium stocksii]